MSITMESEHVRRLADSHSARLVQTSVGAFLRLAVWLAAIAWPLSLQAQQEGDWVGKRVVQKYPGFQLEKGVTDTKHALKTYRVERVNGPWLWLRAVGEGLSGWAPADHVVPVEQAVEFFTGYIRLHPADVHAYTMRAKIWVEEKREYDNALGDYNEAIRLDPTNAYCYYNRGTLWSAKKDYDKAIADFDESIKIYPSFAIAYYDRANAWRGKKEYDKAIADFNEAIRIDPSLSRAYNNRGLAWSDKKEYRKAIADFNEAIRIDPAIANWPNSLGWLLAACPDASFRDGKKAVEFATKACTLSEWKEAYPVGTLAAAYAEAGNFDEAVKWQTKANGMYTDADDKEKGEERLKLYREKKPYRHTNR